MITATNERAEPPIRGLRILAFCDYFSPASCGGSERAALEIYRRLAAMGAEILVMTALPHGLPPPTDIQGITVKKVPAFDFSRVLGAQLAVAPTLFTTGRAAEDFRPHLLHANTIYFQSSLAAARYQRRSGLPLITTVQIGSLGHLPQPVRSLTSVYEHTVGRFILRRSQKIIAVSESVRQHLLSLGIEGSRIEVVGNGVDLERFRPVTTARRPSVPPTVMFVGRLITNKGPHILLTALQMLHGEGVRFRAEFVGDGPLRRSLERRARKSGLSDRVRFSGPSRDVPSRLRQADVLVRPSLTEGLPLAVLEAMASGVCVVASSVPGNRDLIQPSRNGLLFEAANAAALAGSIRAVLEDAALRDRLAEAGRITAADYSWDRSAAGTASVFARIISRREPALATC